jgi:phosphoribosylaminoimidazole-succinocarboxamide synthase
MKSTALLTTSIARYPKRTGKVRDIYELPDQLLIVATDRISAFDVVMPNGIPDKGRVLTQISAFWFGLLADVTPNHLISTALKDLPADCRDEELDGRFMLCRKCKVVPIECVVRGYLAGSGWKEYKESGTVCGIALPAGLKQCSELPEPIFTPSTKAEIGHDENISFDQAAGLVGLDMMTQLRDRSLEVYKRGRAYAAERGIILADTKFEWGTDEHGELRLIDEVLTPDSSRFWPADQYKPGRDQPSFDKQFVRDYLDKVKFNRTPPGPVLPADIVQKTRAKYIEAFTRLTGQDFQWE